MAANETTVPTESQKTSSHKYVKKIAVQLSIKCRIEKVGSESVLERCSLRHTRGAPFQFEALMKSTKPGGGSLWSEGVSSELVQGAEWKLEIYPNGESGEERGNIGLYLHLTGQMVKWHWLVGLTESLQWI
jgi:hypothetical protein